jgi:hypothetical protein
MNGYTRVKSVERKLSLDSLWIRHKFMALKNTHRMDEFKVRRMLIMTFRIYFMKFSVSHDFSENIN